MLTTNEKITIIEEQIKTTSTLSKNFAARGGKINSFIAALCSFVCAALFIAKYFNNKDLREELADAAYQAAITEQISASQTDEVNAAIAYRDSLDSGNLYRWTIIYNYIVASNLAAILVLTKKNKDSITEVYNSTNEVVVKTKSIFDLIYN